LNRVKQNTEPKLVHYRNMNKCEALMQYESTSTFTHTQVSISV